MGNGQDDEDQHDEKIHKEIPEGIHHEYYLGIEKKDRKIDIRKAGTNDLVQDIEQNDAGEEKGKTGIDELSGIGSLFLYPKGIEKQEGFHQAETQGDRKFVPPLFYQQGIKGKEDHRNRRRQAGEEYAPDIMPDYTVPAAPDELFGEIIVSPTLENSDKSPLLPLLQDKV
jgi:hypothetical protein